MSSRVEEYDAYFRGKPMKGFAPMVERLIIQYLDKYPHKTILDLGCGVGNNLQFLSYVWPESYLTGVDISPVALETALRKVPSAKFVESELEKVEFLAPFDVIFLIGVLEHLPDIDMSLRKVKTLSSGVVFVRTIFNADRFKGYARPGFGDNQMEWNYPASEWENIFEKNGFEIVEQVTGLGLMADRDLAWIIRGVNG
jgi:2-polyprenyl-3-methyl-5-hydroxy-6-metoxy-1,4-benzoquinol methylase